MRASNSRLSLSNLLSCFTGNSSPKAATQAGINADAGSSVPNPLHPLKRATVNALNTNWEQAGVAGAAGKYASAPGNMRFVNASSRSASFAHTAKTDELTIRQVNLVGLHHQSLQKSTVHRGAVNRSKKSVKEEETLLTLRFEILKLPTNLNVRCNASLAKIQKIAHPGRRIEMLEQLLSKLTNRSSEGDSPSALVMTSYQDVVTQMSRKKSDEVTAMRVDLLKIGNPHAVGYQNLLRDVLARPDSKERDDFLTKMAQDIKSHLV
ncbi:MAG: hypothetical protein V4695_04180 [Pseudomonadota bacterium]